MYETKTTSSCPVCSSQILKTTGAPLPLAIQDASLNRARMARDFQIKEFQNSIHW